MKKIVLTSLLLLFVFFVSAQTIQNVDTIFYPADSLKNFNKALFSDSLASSFYIVIKNDVKAHKHIRHSEHIYVLDGTAEMKMDNKTFKLSKGDFVFIPKNAVHAVKVTSAVPLKIISIQSPNFDGTDRVFVE